ncbi:MAG: hypothetical protein JRN29_01390 [Nitrososphaerota archaeon]|nr:hypothetical protein [Nitrososphaerota archaeon]
MRAVSTVVIVGIIVAVVVVGGVGAYFALGMGRSPPPSPPPSNGGTGSLGAVSTAFASHLNLISTRDVTSLMQGYESNATVVWEGNAAGLQGTYPGSDNIQILYSKALSTASVFQVTNTSYSVRSPGTNLAVVNASVAMTGNSSILGSINGTISVQVNYVYTTGAWMISQETWNFKVFNVQYSSGATTFPEWQKVGLPITTHTGPDLLHNVAWVYGPGLALFIYAFIAMVAVAAVVKKTWKR